jgi:hypothetical protein
MGIFYGIEKKKKLNGNKKKNDPNKSYLFKAMKKVA